VNLPAAQHPTVGDIGAGHTLGRYELLMPIATGGMAMVWAARLKGTRGFQKIVAIKTMLPKLSDEPHFEQMFLDEASLASQVRHPHVVEILDLGEQDGVLYLVMEWIDGVPLNQVIKVARKHGGVPLPVAVRVTMQACAGLHAAHELRDPAGQLVGLVHRDISPQNILVTYDGVAKVVDFGVAKATAGGGGATQAGQIKGKVAYMAPEQIRGETIDRRIDVFSMGCVLYLLTTGKHPFRKEADGATLFNICAPEPAVSPRRLIPSYPLTLERVVMQALAKDPAKRLPTANDLLRSLDQALPASMRASTDDEVAKFIHSLFSEKREEQRGALQSALARADVAFAEKRERLNSQQSEVKLRDFLDSAPPPSVASGVSAVSTGDFAAVSAEGSNPSTPNLILPDALRASRTDITASTPDLAAFVGKKRSAWPWLLGLGVLAVGGAVAFFTLSGSKPQPAEPVAATQKPAVAAPKAEQPKPQEKTVAAAETASAEPAAPEPSASEEPEKKVAPRVHWGAPKPRPTATSKPTKPPGSPAWRQDPGF
jgi:eukaryotic-like serine/threonine-protein kinase